VKDDVTAPGRAALTRGGFLLGMFFDGDGDRLDIYRGDGAYLSSSFAYAAILPFIRERLGDAGRSVFADLKSNPLAVIEMAKCGVDVRVVRNGHSQIKHTLMGDPSAIGAVEESAHFYEAFERDGGRYCTENTLYIALLVTRAWLEDPVRFDELMALQSTVAREREWGFMFPSNAARADALAAVEEHFAAQGLRAMCEMDTGMDLEATLMRRGLPFQIGVDTVLCDDWLQVCHRASQSEDGLARWEVVGHHGASVRQAKREVAEVVSRFGAGDEYQG
jgi:phosphomannomutase